MQIARPVLNFVKNKYFVALLAFLVWMTFFDPKDWGLIRARTRKLKELHQSEQELSAKIRDTKSELILLKTDASSVEKYAREKFYMKKDNEDLFIVRTQ